VKHSRECCIAKNHRGEAARHYFPQPAGYGKVCSVSAVTETTPDISVTVETMPIEEESRPSEGVFAFAYTIRIENRSSDTVQLMERHWVIESADEKIGEVVGPGVVGVQPILEPGQHFEYTSSTVIKDPVGAMKGMYIFNRKDGGFFSVQIPRFVLIHPTLCN
jgi:ApaG protein